MHLTELISGEGDKLMTHCPGKVTSVLWCKLLHLQWHGFVKLVFSWY